MAARKALLSTCAAVLLPILLGMADSTRAGYYSLTQQPVAMRDGTRLSTNVFLPKTGGRFPTVLVRTPYGKGNDLLESWRSFPERGYAVVVQDVRGRYQSSGSFGSMTQESDDGSDTLDWIARQDWSNGNVAMMGGSYLGMVQWRAALSRNPHLKAIFPVVAGCDEYRDRYYSRGGALKLGHRMLWLHENMRKAGAPTLDFRLFTKVLPLRFADRAATGQVLPLFQNALRHPNYDSYWKRTSTCQALDGVRVPAFIVGGWYDNYVQSDLDAYQALRRQGVPARILIGPWPHNMAQRFPQVDYGPNAMAPVRNFQMEWFDRWTRTPQTQMAERAPVKLFTMGSNQWRDEAEWPLARTRYTPLFLASGGNANSSRGNGQLSRTVAVKQRTDRFVYDPLDPVPTQGGAVCCNPRVFPWGPLDQREVEKRQDVLVYTSEVLTRDVEATGLVRAILYVSTTATDTDFTAKLVDVFPSGEARLLTDGILRLRYRRSLEKPVLAEPGRVYPITVDVGVTSNVFLAGHRIRLEVASSNFPKFDRNLNTGRPMAEEDKPKTATQTIYHDAQHPSHLLLPVIPAGGRTLTAQTRTRYLR